MHDAMRSKDKKNESKEENVCVGSWEEKRGIFINMLVLLAQHGSISQKEGYKWKLM